MATGIDDVLKHSVHTLVFRSLKRTHDMFLSDQNFIPTNDEKCEKLWASIKLRSEYSMVKDMPRPDLPHSKKLADHIGGSNSVNSSDQDGDQNQIEFRKTVLSDGSVVSTPVSNSMQLATYDSKSSDQSSKMLTSLNQTLIPRKAPTMPKPEWHPPWKLYRVISGHLGWVRCISVEPKNEWFVTGGGDRVIKIWDLASGTLKLSLTGHISSVRGVCVSPRNPYLFSCGEDKLVKCWDLEYNKVIRHYHGHLSAVYGLDIHPTIDVLLSCGRDATARVWDMRTKACVHTMTGHTNTVAVVKCQAAEPQVITGSHDCTIRLWDLAAGRTRATLTNHKKSIRSLVLHPTKYSFTSGSPDNIKQWKFPDGNFIQNLTGHNAIINTLGMNSDNVLVSGADNGTMYFWDWKTGYNFQRIQAAVQPGSIDSEAGIFACTFDHSGSRLITGEADKSIKIYKEDEKASEETHPINWRPDILKRKRY
ncbi:pleiotropic regulator 1-like [Octopus vulgaris]|uniref:Pleiotropic regulator 1-like n=3 Tax=Octopus TaxID=6643 RepID=A0AA36BJQ0_OCTVU|nr:pleiotropic regulator 1 [Octopus sinensis]CAI9735388.1 pleiotropic regulator 1-like [Octopus vulgaris]